MSTHHRQVSAAWPVWLRIGLAVSVLATAGLGLFVGTQLHPATEAAPAVPGGEQSNAYDTDQVAAALALHQAQLQLDHQARRVLAGNDRRTAGLSFRRYSLTIPVSATASAAELSAGKFQTSVVERYRLPVERLTVGRTADATFRLQHGHWRLARLTGDGQDLWDYEPSQAASDGRTLVVGSTAIAGQLAQLARDAEAARRQVADFWGARWSDRVVVVVPATGKTLGQLVGNPSANRLPAVTNRVTGPDGPVTRVTLNPRVFLAFPTIARQIVLRHEITHVAQDARAAGEAPTWLVEGLAEYVGYRGTAIPDSVVGRDAFNSVRGDGVPAAFPSEADFAFKHGSAERSLAYERGWAVCRTIADRYGEGRLVPFYRAVVTGSGSADSRIDQASRAVLGISGSTLLAQWQAWLAERA